MNEEKKINDDFEMIDFEEATDDNIETFDKRYDTYCKETKPLIDFYKSKNILCEIDSSLSKEIVFDKIKKVLEDLE